MDMQFKIPVIPFCTLVEHQFHECQLFAVLTEERVSLENWCIGQSCQEKEKKCLKGYFMFFFYLDVCLCLTLITFLCGGLSCLLLFLKALLRIWGESKWKSGADFSTAPIYSIPGFSVCFV